MNRKIFGLITSFLMVTILILASCAPSATTQPTATQSTAAPTIEPTTIKPTTPVETGPEMVKLTLTKLDGTVVEKLVEKPRYGGTINVGADVDPGNCDPGNGQTQTNQWVINFIHERLQIGDYRRGPAGTKEYAFTLSTGDNPKWRIGHVAESWEQPDPQTFIWHLRKGVTYQNIPPVNGRELTADDVVYSIKYLQSSPRIGIKYLGNIESAVAKDKYTVVTKLKVPDYMQLTIMGDGSYNWVTIAREVVEKFGNLTESKSAIGTGPWILTDYVRGSLVTYKKNPTYWKQDEMFPGNSMPYADNVKVLIIPDASTRMSAMRAGKVDVIFRHLFWQDAEGLKKTNPEIGQQPHEGAGMLGIRIRVDRPATKDIRVRQALTMAIDQNSVVKDYLRGNGAINGYPTMADFGEEVWTPVEKMSREPAIPGSRAGVREMFEYNPEKAKQLLAEAGYPKGLQIKIIAAPTEIDSTSLVAGYWQQIGVDTKIDVRDYTVKMNMVTARPRSFDADAIVQYTNTSDPIAIWQSGYITNGPYNPGNISDPHVDQTVLDMLAEPDDAKRDKMAKDLNLYALEQAWNIAGPSAYYYNFWQPWVKNAEGTSCISPGGGQTYALMHYWVDRDLKEKMTGIR